MSDIIKINPQNRPIKLLHISHHVGCMRDKAYVYDKLGFDYSFWKFHNDLFKISKEVADSVWNEKKDYFNSFDYIVTSDTAPLSRIFMENIAELKPKVVVWICNRFDYNMERDPTYYEIFNRVASSHKEQFKIVPYSDFESIWCRLHNISPIHSPITPIGRNPIELDDKIDCLQMFKDKYIKDPNSKEVFVDVAELTNKIFIPIYGNDNKFLPMKEILEKHGVSCYNGGYNHPHDLKICKGLVTFPEQYSKLITFETIQNQVIVFLPSKNFLISLHPMANNGVRYWFNSPVGNLNDELISLCEWYRYENCRIYFDSLDDLLNKIINLTPEIVEEKREWCRIYGEQIERENMEKWRTLFFSDL